MGRKKSGKPRRPRGTAPAAPSHLWGNWYTPNPITGRFETTPDARQDTVRVWDMLGRVAPSYAAVAPDRAGSVPYSALLLQSMIEEHGGVVITGEGGPRLVPLAEFDAPEGDDIELHLHHLHAYGYFGVTQAGQVRILRQLGPEPSAG